MFNLFSNLDSNQKRNNTDKEYRHYILKNQSSQRNLKVEEEIIFGCGCFWGAEKGFWKLPGVIYTSVGYAGGHKENPNYNEVCAGITGHTEVVRVIWDRRLIDISDLLKLFWECHDPTQGNRQGNDSGTQYRSAIYTNKTDHYIKAIASRDAFQESLIKKGFGEITTEIKENIIFHIAENYHQQYLAKPGNRQYCSAMPTKVRLEEFKGSNFKLSKDIWSNFNWDSNKCILNSDNMQLNQRNVQ